MTDLHLVKQAPSNDGGIVLGSSTDRDAWLALRRSGVGASEVAAVLGESPWLSATQLYAEKIGEMPRDAEEPEWLYWGNALETAIIAGYQDRTGRPVQRANVLLRSRECPWLLCTLDGLTGEADGAVSWPLEVKNIGAHKAAAWEHGTPRHYYLQLQQQMLVTETDRATIAALIGGQRMVWEDIRRDEVEIRRIKLASRIFWEQCVEQRQCPKPDASDSASRALHSLYRSRPHPDAHVKFSATIVDLDAELCRIKEDQKPMQERRKEIENLIKATLGTASHGVMPDGATYSWKRQSNGVSVLRRHRSRMEAT